MRLGEEVVYYDNVNAVVCIFTWTNKI